MCARLFLLRDVGFPQFCFEASPSRACKHPANAHNAVTGHAAASTPRCCRPAPTAVESFCGTSRRHRAVVLVGPVPTISISSHHLITPTAPHARKPCPRPESRHVLHRHQEGPVDRAVRASVCTSSYLQAESARRILFFPIFGSHPPCRMWRCCPLDHGDVVFEFVLGN